MVIQKRGGKDKGMLLSISADVSEIHPTASILHIEPNYMFFSVEKHCRKGKDEPEF